MNRKLSLFVIVSLLTLLVSAGGTAARGEQHLSPAGEQAASLGTAFTYQGQLTDSGGPVDDDCDFQFSLWDAAGGGEPPTGGTQVGTTQARANVAVSDGLFTIPDLDFGDAAFTGDARWLQIAVRCPADSGDYATLAPRQALTPAPYALALPGLRTQQNATSPNLIGGYSGNQVADGVHGATIGGGGEDGGPNIASYDYATVGGGIGNTASAGYATVGGGTGNRASDNRATVGGGTGNEASNVEATVGGGVSNHASGYRATIGGGESNYASYSFATIGGGRQNAASGNDSTIGGGRDNEVSGNYATVPGGKEAAASHYGEMAYASGSIYQPGDAQTSVYVLRNSTIGETPTELFLDGTDDRLTIATDRTVTFDILLAARSLTGDSIGCIFQGIIENTGDTTAFVMAPGKLCQKGGLSWDATLVADDDNDALQIVVTGPIGSTSIGWVARVQTAEVSY